MTWLAWAIPLVIVIFLWDLNEFLRGYLKGYISAGLALLAYGLCGVAFFVSGWIVGLIALVGVCILLALLHYPALIVARKLTKYPDLGAIDHWERQAKKTFRNSLDFGSPKYWELQEKQEREKAEHMTETVNKALNRTDIQEVLERLSCSKRDLEAFYQRFEIHSLPPIDVRKIG